MHDHQDIDDHYDDDNDEHNMILIRWDASPRNLSFNFGAKIARAYFASGQSMPIRHRVIFHHLATFGGRWLEKGVWFLKGAKKHWFFLYFFVRISLTLLQAVNAYQTPRNILPPLERARWRGASDIFEGKMIQSDFTSTIIASDYQDN